MTILPPIPDPSSADEINHRVSNSLQLVVAMVAVEARAIQDGAVRAMLETVQRRISAIAGVHRQLYQWQQEERVDLGRYLTDLGAMLEQSCGDGAAGRRVTVRADALALSAPDATAIGIITSELVGNACKYAYAYGTPGIVRIVLKAAPRGGYRLEIEDRGRGISALRQPEGTGLGRQLVAMMSARLGGRARWEDARPGTRFVLDVEGR